LTRQSMHGQSGSGGGHNPSKHPQPEICQTVAEVL
jgi:hypothetical protein